MKPLALAMGAFLPLCAQQIDLYPGTRALIREAETAAASNRNLDDRRSETSWAGRLYERAGYLDDAVRAFGNPAGACGLYRARTVYGDLAGAQKCVEAISDLERRAAAFASLGDLLWRMGQPDEARIRLEAARRLAPQIENPDHRKRVLASVAQNLEYLLKEPPHRVSAKPEPEPRRAIAESPIPPFPITTDGFRPRDPKEVGTRASNDSEFMTKLYDRMAASDRAGLEKVIDEAATPFQKTLGLASVEHILIQAAKPEAAESYAMRMPDGDTDCRLAKSEALAAAASAWLRAGNDAKARADFTAAVAFVQSVTELPFGKLTVVLSIATAQAKGGMLGMAGEGFRLAKQFALDVLLPPAPSKSYRLPPPWVHYRDDAYHSIFEAAIEAHDLGAAYEAAELWRQTNTAASGSIISAFLKADRIDDAIAWSRTLPDPHGKAGGLLTIARELLDRAGAPNF
jgi:tetratricopeptide (TPR) repeat protein